MAQKTLFTNEIVELHCSRRKRPQIFKQYCTTQDFLLPKKISDFIAPSHIGIIVSQVIDNLDIIDIEDTYLGGGTSAYSPRMLLKVWILGFVYKIYTCRPLVKTLKENMAFIWISGNQTPDFHTLNNFRLRLKKDLKQIFKEVVRYALELGVIECKDVFIDHSKTESNSNRYKMVWRKQVKRSLSNIDKEVDDLFDYIDKLNEDEDKEFGGKDLPEMERNGFDKDKVQELIDKSIQTEKNNAYQKKKRKNLKPKCDV